MNKKHTVFILCVSLWGIAVSDASLWDDAGVESHGFIDVRGGMRVQTDPTQKDQSLQESRFQFDLYRGGDLATLKLRADFLYDAILSEQDVDIEEGRGALDLREAYLLFYPMQSIDVKVGRQILTWGTGDLLFINDMFPKDWQSFFIGRDEEYLKAPSDAFLVSFFPEIVSIDLAYTPRFDADRYIRGERLSYWNPMAGSVVGREAIVDADRLDGWFEDDEVAARVYRNVGAYEVALYGYAGYWKSPAGFDPIAMRATFPRLNVYGASIRGTAMNGVISAEAGYYDSLDNRDGDDPSAPNSQSRVLVGYEREVAQDLTAGIQYYLEFMSDYDAYLAGVQDPSTAADEDRHVVTLRLTQLLMNQNLILSLFAYCSPSDQDAYLRPVVSYKMSDVLQVTAGGNVFLGEGTHTFFGQFQDNSNIYVGVRYSY
ncbi:MAG: hypothetical protein ISS35_04275 [Kiritimatiellae bacterium]|nr:hypothetical protein [Kiritimatiellia bacterium]